MLGRQRLALDRVSQRDLPVTAPRVRPGKGSRPRGALRGLWAAPAELPPGTGEAGLRDTKPPFHSNIVRGVMGVGGSTLLFGYTPLWCFVIVEAKRAFPERGR